MSDLFQLSTYHVPVTVVDEDGNSFDVSNASVEYQMNANNRSGEQLFNFTDADSQIVMSVGDVNEFEVRIDASQMDVPQKVFEEIRITESGRSAVSLQRTVDFNEVVTSP